MYNDKIDTTNKIITSEDLVAIFDKINTEMINVENLSKQEALRNESIEHDSQTWTYKNFNKTFKCTFNFYDSTNITVDNYDAFINLYNDRLNEIKDMWVRCNMFYSNGIGYKTNQVSNSLTMFIYEHKMEITTNLSSSDQHMNSVYELIKEKILNAPERYDEVIRKKSSISNKIGLASGLIISLIICTLAALIPLVRQIYGMTYILFPIAALLLGFMIGNSIFRGKIDSLYSTIEPSKKYVGWDSANSKSVYTDDINEFTSKSEILIGKNVNNLNIRKEILEMDKKYSSLLSTELIILVALSIVIVVISKLIG